MHEDCMLSTSSGAPTERSPMVWRVPGAPLRSIRTSAACSPVAPSVLMSAVGAQERTVRPAELSLQM